ncbi:L-serine ammonia-lyase [Clavibacter michiganensis]|nr:L-serine ammonia-lyase [Clavibacter michiganensis]
MTAYVSALDLFSIGIGPSSSHTVGPMRAALLFAEECAASPRLTQITRVTVRLFGSLGATGLGHGTPDAVVAGLAGLAPETCDPDEVRGRWSGLGEGVDVPLAGIHPVRMVGRDLTFEPFTRLPRHPNAMHLAALDADGGTVLESTWFSVGGGFVLREDQAPSAVLPTGLPHSFSNADELIALAESTGRSIADVARDTEESIHGSRRAVAGLDAIWDAMAACVTAGLGGQGTLPGGLNVRRRAARVASQLATIDAGGTRDTSHEWLHAFALAVNEENASGGRVVTAPTNGAAGIIPAVGSYYLRFVPGADRDGIRDFLLTATAIGSLVKANASISGAEAGCQGEVGTACAMAAGALCAVLGGSPRQVENAAEIAMEHHLGLTCDPVGGLVQIPCIERNAIAASTAVNAARMALHGDGTHLVSLDTVIETMRQTGLDMSTKYKETSTGGLAVNVIEC